MINFLTSGMIGGALSLLLVNMGYSYMTWEWWAVMMLAISLAMTTVMR